MRIYPTEGLTKNKLIEIGGVDGASFEEAANALLLDMRRRLKAGELLSLKIEATDKKGNTIVATP